MGTTMQFHAALSIKPSADTRTCLIIQCDHYYMMSSYKSVLQAEKECDIGAHTGLGMVSSWLIKNKLKSRSWWMASHQPAGMLHIHGKFIWVLSRCICSVVWSYIC